MEKIEESCSSSSSSSSSTLSEQDQLKQVLREKIKNENTKQIEGLQAAVMMMRAKDPQRYEKAQYIGSSYMNRNYDLEVGFDDEGSEIKSKELMQHLKNGLLDIDELTVEEINTLNKIYGDEWRKNLSS